MRIANTHIRLSGRLVSFEIFVFLRLRKDLRPPNNARQRYARNKLFTSGLVKGSSSLVVGQRLSGKK